MYILSLSLKKPFVSLRKKKKKERLPPCSYLRNIFYGFLFEVVVFFSQLAKYNYSVLQSCIVHLSVLIPFHFKVQLRAAVVLSQEYPTTPPFFSIEVCCGKAVIQDSSTKVSPWL